MNAIARLQAFDALNSSEREMTVEQGLLVQVREGDALSRYRWTAGELAEITEPDGTRWSYGYGSDGRLLSVHLNGEAFAYYDYDDAGRLTRVSRPDAPKLHSYDSEGRLVRTLRGDASPFLYRWEGSRVASAQSDRESSRFHYDPQGRLVGIDQQVDGHVVSTRFHFDEAGRLGRVEFLEWGQHVDFAWDDRGRPAETRWNGQLVSLHGTDDATSLSWSESAFGLREETWHDAPSGRAVCKAMSHQGREIWRCELRRDEAFRLVQEGSRTYQYDRLGRLSEAQDESRQWHYAQDGMDRTLDGNPTGLRDAAGRLRGYQRGGRETVYRYNDAGELVEALVNGARVARCVYDHKGRLVLKAGPNGTERYVYGPDDGLLAIADAEGRPRLLFLRTPTGLVGLIDFRSNSQGEIVGLHSDASGNLVYASFADGSLEGPLASDPYGMPLQAEGRVPYAYRGRWWHSDLGLYRLGCRWYDPMERQFLTPDSQTGAPDDERLVNPFRLAHEQRMSRVQILGDWLRQPRLRNRFAYCSNDPINRFDPNGHWSFGGVLLSLLGVLWTLPNTAFGLAIEVTCLLGEVVRWIVWLCSGGHATWQTPGFDVAASGRLNAFALIFKGGWLGSFDSLLGITFGNVIFVNGEYQNSPAWQALPDPVTPPAYNGTVTIPKSQALYEHELRHVNQYGWWGPFFHLGLPIFGIYEWDVILNGYQNASFEKDARDHGGF
jgi:RHS repeat-associated protein